MTLLIEKMQKEIPTFPIGKIIVSVLVLFLIITVIYYLYKKIMTEHLTMDDIYVPIENKLGGMTQFKKEREPVFE